jgi:hypothetical protein
MKTFFLACLLCLSLGAFSQKWEKSVNVNYNWTYLSQSIEGDFNLYKNHSTLSFGTQVYLNQYPDFEDGSFKNAGYAANWYDRFGLNLSYQYNIFKDFRAVNPFLFYQSLFSHLSLRKPAYNSSEFYWTMDGHTDPYWISENVIGFGFIFQLYKDVNVFQSAGYGYSLFFGDDNYTIGVEGEWAYTLKLGLLYRIN